MQKTILITGSSDGLGFATAKMLLNKGQNVLLHARDSEKLAQATALLQQETNVQNIKGYVCDLSRPRNVIEFAKQVQEEEVSLDVLINNAGVFKVPETRTPEGLDIRFAVNTLAPYLLTQNLLPVLNKDARVINLSSAAQTTIDLGALLGKKALAPDAAYAMSKLALIIVTRYFANKEKASDKVFLAVNPKSFLGTQMVKNAYGMAGFDVNIGATILTKAALEDGFKTANGKYFDNDIGQFSTPHPDALDPRKAEQVINALTEMAKR